MFIKYEAAWVMVSGDLDSHDLFEVTNLNDLATMEYYSLFPIFIMCNEYVGMGRLNLY
jgi:hypothetical protein